MANVDTEILEDVKTTLRTVPGVRRVLGAGTDGVSEFGAGDLPGLAVVWEETEERWSGADAGEVRGRVHFHVSVVTQEGKAWEGLSRALQLSEAVRSALMTDVTRGGLASTGPDGAATQIGRTKAVVKRKPPTAEVQVEVSCGYYRNGA